MKLKVENIKSFPAHYTLPQFDIPEMVARTKESPTWLHMGAGNIFRIFVAGAQQKLLCHGHTDTGIIAYEAFDEEIIPQSFTPYDNLTMAVTLFADGSVNKRVIASIADAFCNDLANLCQVIAKPTMQMISFTITEKGYAVDPAKVCTSPSCAATTIEQVTAGLLARFNAGVKPLALVSLDNFAENGTVLAKGILAVAEAWQKSGHVQAAFTDYVKSLAYPWTMIDKITPRPSPEVAKLLEADGFEDTAITQTKKDTFVASFVNAEAAGYLVIEDKFPNGRPPLEKAGVYMTDRETVRKTDQMKVCACLNPLHTVLGVVGTLLNYPTIAACMKDTQLVKLVNLAANEALPTVANPGIIDPEKFLNEVLTERFPNPFIPDTPARINCDASQKVPVRFGETLKERKARGLDIANLEAIPLFIALWLRYRMGKDDNGAEMELSPDPRLPEVFKALDNLGFGDTVDLSPMLSDVKTFGVDLYEVKLAEKVEALFYELSAGGGAVSRKLAELK